MLSLIASLLLLLDHMNAQICDQAICEYNFEIRRFRTMTYYNGVHAYNVELNGTRLEPVENSYRLKVDDDFIGTELDPYDVITADGYVRDIITINDKFPGPNLQVLAGSQVGTNCDMYVMVILGVVTSQGCYVVFSCGSKCIN